MALPASPAISRRVFTDIDEQAACLGGYDQHYQQIGRGRFAGSFATRSVGPDVTMYVEDINQDLHQRGRAPGGFFSVGLLLQQAGRCTFAGQPIDQDALVVFPGGIEFDGCFAASTRFCVVEIRQEHVASTEEDALGSTVTRRSALERSGGTTVMRPGHARLAALRRLIASTMQADGGGASTHRELALEDALVEQTLALTTDETAIGAPRRWSARERHLVYCRARDYLDAHAAEPFSMADLCRSVSVSRRTLEKCFAASIGQSPASYLRTLRLNGLRRDLLARRAGAESIGDLAARWGLWHPSRMAGYYRAQFGELPSETAMRS